MATKIFVNLPVKDLQRSIRFFSDLGFSFNQQFTDETATCMVISDDIYAMLLTESRFKDFTRKQVADASSITEAILALGVNSRQEVDRIADKALASGGQPSNEPQDHGFMYTRSFQDPDGHLWEVLYMDPSYVQQ